MVAITKTVLPYWHNLLLWTRNAMDLKTVLSSYCLLKHLYMTSRGWLDYIARYHNIHRLWWHAYLLGCWSRLLIALLQTFPNLSTCQSLKVNFLENGKQPEWSQFQSSIGQQEGPGHEVCVIFFDVRKALIDSVPHLLLLDQLQVINVNPYLLKWISNYSSDRRFLFVTIEGGASDIKFTRGVWRSTGKL